MQPATDTPGGEAPAPPPDPNLILVLNLLVFGCAGYWLLGQKNKAILAGVLWVAGLTTCGVVSGLVAAFAAIDGYREANRLRTVRVEEA